MKHTRTRTHKQQDRRRLHNRFCCSVSADGWGGGAAALCCCWRAQRWQPSGSCKLLRGATTDAISIVHITTNQLKILAVNQACVFNACLIHDFWRWSSCVWRNAGEKSGGTTFRSGTDGMCVCVCAPRTNGTSSVETVFFLNKPLCILVFISAR